MPTRDVRYRLLEDLQRLRDPQGYFRAGWPRYHTLFGRDSLIAAWQTLDINPSIARATLSILARYQGKSVNDTSEEEPGKILHEHRFDATSQAELPRWKFPYYGSVDSTLLFLIVTREYVSRTRDEATLSALWPAVERAHAWIQNFGDLDGDGLIEYRRRNPHGLFHQGWKDGSEDHLKIAPPVALVEVQGYAIAAHRSFADLADLVGRREDAVLARESATELQGALMRSFWWPSEGTFVLALDGTKHARAAVTSNPGHLLVCDAVDRKTARSIAKRLFRSDLWTPYGIRTHASSDPDYDPYGYHTGTVWPHDNWIIYKGFRKMGFRREALRIRDSLLRAHAALRRIPELYAVVDGSIVDLSDAPVNGTRANPIQAWATAGLLEMLESRKRVGSALGRPADHAPNVVTLQQSENEHGDEQDTD